MTARRGSTAGIGHGTWRPEAWYNRPRRLFVEHSQNVVSHSKTSPAAAPWQVEAVRLTAFLPAASSLDPESWWAELTGQPPERQISWRKQSQSQSDGLLARPDLPAARLVLKTERARVDWLLGPELESQEGPPDIGSAHLGPLPDVLPVFCEMMLRWLATTGLDVTRLALGVTLRLPVKTKEEAYSLMSNYLPFNLAPESSDFLYRINRPRPSASLDDGTIVNRLATWAVIRVQTLVISASVGGAATQEVSREGEPFVACRLELDISTAGDRPGILPQDRFEALLAEFADVAAEIAARGDRP